jgi:hypothetical protein
MKEIPISALSAFRNKEIIILKNECWTLKAPTNGPGYKYIYVPRDKGKRLRYLLHRVSYLYFNGPFDPKLFVCHKCDNPPCCNPDHLFLGTPKQNTQDCIAKGRFNQTVDMCKRGHDLRGKEHRWPEGSKWRGCLTCFKLTSRIKRIARKLQTFS